MSTFRAAPGTEWHAKAVPVSPQSQANPTGIVPGLRRNDLVPLFLSLAPDRCRRLKGSDDGTYYLERDELAGLPALQRSYYAAKGVKSAYVFVNEWGRPFGRMGIARMIERGGELA
jgi:hypothetical protein